VGRTAAQCLEHYEKLLDQAQEKEDDLDDETEDPRRLRPGEIDPNPESKPARPDPVDMDEDEKEMLSEARARLANTQGKKAKRKAREKQLEESRRLASLQKRRELKAAGIELPKHRRKNGVDYISEVPFERKAPAGFFSAGKEGDEVDGTNAFKKISLEGLEGKRRDKQEDEDRKNDAKAKKRKQEKNMPQAVMEVNKLNDAEQVRKRTKLVLDRPQVTEDELEEIAKLQQRGGAAMDDDGSAATRTLMGNYSDATPSLAGRTPMRTPKSDGDHLRMEAQNLIALTAGETPLAGGQNADLHRSDFSGATPKARVAQTPNPMSGMTPGGSAARGGMTPLLQSGRTPGSTPGATPLRDQLGLNEDPDAALRNREQKRSLLEGLSSLPQAKNAYQIMAPEMPTDDEPTGALMEEDAADIEERNATKLKEKERQALKERSGALKRQLPRPLVVQEERIVAASSDGGKDGPGALIAREMYEMMEDDGVRFPVRSNQAQDAQYVMQSKSSLAHHSLNDLATASGMLKEELANVILDSGVSKEDDAGLWQEAAQELIFVPSKGEYVHASKVSAAQATEAHMQEFTELKNMMTKEAKRANKLEKKLNTLTQGYNVRSEELLAEIQEMHTEQETKLQELKCFQALEKQERFALPLRVGGLKEDVEAAKKRETQLQHAFASKRDELQALRKAAFA